MSDRDLPAALANYAERKHRRTSPVERALIRLAFLPQLLQPRLDERKLAAPIRLESERIELHTEREVQVMRYELRRAGMRPDLVTRALAFVMVRAGNRLPLPPTNGALAAAALLLAGRAVERESGDDRALACALAATVAAMAGKPVHVIVPTGHFARRRHEQMQPLFDALELSSAYVDEGIATDRRRSAYRADIVYCAQRTVALDYLSDRLALKGRAGSLRMRTDAIGSRSSVANELMLNGLHWGIVDEADIVLADAAQSALTVDSDANMSQEVRWLQEALMLAAQLRRDVDYAVPQSPAVLAVQLSVSGRAKLAQLARDLSGIWQGANRREEIVELALAATVLLEKDRDYVVAADAANEARLKLSPDVAARAENQTQVRLLRLMLEIKESCAITATRQTLARMTYQRLVSSYVKCAVIASDLSGLGGELWRVCRVRRARVGRADRADVIMGGAWRNKLAHASEIESLAREALVKAHPLLLVTRDHAAAKALSTSLADAGIANACLLGLQNEEEGTAFTAAATSGRITVMPHTAACGLILQKPETETQPTDLAIVFAHLLPSQRHERGFLRRCRAGGVTCTVVELLNADDELIVAYASAWLSRWAHLLPGRSMQKYCQWRHASETALLREELLRADDYLGELFAFAGHAG